MPALNVPDTFAPELEHLALHVLEEQDPETGKFTAVCLESGTVASAPDVKTLRQLIQKTLELEITLAVRNNNFANFFRKPASGEAWARWHRAAADPAALDTLTLKLKISVETVPRREVKSEIQISKASIPRTA